MNMKRNKPILVAGTMAFDEIITTSANSGKIIGGAATYISYSSSFFTKDIYVSLILTAVFIVLACLLQATFDCSIAIEF